MRTTSITMVSAVLVAGFCAGHALAADPAPTGKPSQQSKMKTCNADAQAKSLKGAERKAFMSECLKAK